MTLAAFATAVMVIAGRGREPVAAGAADGAGFVWLGDEVSVVMGCGGGPFEHGIRTLWRGAGGEGRAKGVGSQASAGELRMSWAY
jgi:hypothetical protein